MSPSTSRLLPWALLLTLLACVDDVSTGPGAASGREAALAVRAQVMGLRAAGGPYNVAVAVSYEAAAGALVRLPVSRESFPVTDAGTQVQQTFQVVLDPCLGDADRALAASGGCQLWLNLVLSDPDGELASETVNLGVVRDRDQFVSSAPVLLVPKYTLTIAGGGTGTGSGTITVPAVAGQPELSCEITAGTAAATGCTARYPLDTTLALTPSEGTLAAWGADCGTVAATGPCQLTLDGHRTATASFTVPRTTGDLTVQIAGLPDGIAAQVTVTNSRGYRQDLSQTTTLTDLAPGDDYLVAAAPVFVPAEEQAYTPAPAEQPASVVAGQSGTVQIGYNPPETGSLAVTILGLQAEVGGLVTVTGPSLVEPRALTAGETLTRLEPGPYTVVAQAVETSDQIYDPLPLTQTSTVLAGATVHDTVSYSTTRGALTVSVSGLPNGILAAITIAGPGGFSQPLPGTATLVKLVPGTYEVAAGNVRVEGRTFSPDIPTQSIAVIAGASLGASVGYSVLPPVRLEKATEDGVTCIVNTFCPDIFGVRAIDAAGNTVAGATVRWTAGDASPGCPQGSHTDVTTGLDGIARASNQCRYPTPGSYTQTAALVIGGQVVSSTQVSFTFRLVTGPPSATRSTVEISPDTLLTCCDTATVTVTARDEAGDPLSGLRVVLEASGAAAAIQAQPSETTNASGVATGRVIGRTIGSAQIAARIDGVLLEQTATLIVTAGIAFVRDGDIFAVSQDGSNPINLTRGVEGEASSPAWSPDGSRIAFTVRRCNTGFDCDDIYVMNADGTEALNLTAGFAESAFTPTWSPDGDFIAFVTFPCIEGACGTIWVMQSTGSTPTRLTPEFGTASSPDWSRDGSKIVFLLYVCDEGCHNTLAVMDADGANRVILTEPFDFERTPGSPKWSPDGTKIAFTLFTCSDGCVRDIAVVTAGGLDLVNLTEALDDQASFPAWSPGGGRIAFARDTCQGGFCLEINIMSSRDGSALTPLLPGSEPSWR